MSARDLTKKHISVDLTLGPGSAYSSFSGGGRTKILNGLACNATIEKCGLPYMNQCRIDVANVSQDTIEKITTLNTVREQINIGKNTIVVKAWKDGESPAVAYKGTIFIAYGTYGSPDLGVHIEANTGLEHQTTAEGAYTKGGETNVIQLMESLAKQCNFSFKNNKVPKKISRDVVYSGSPIEKMKAIALEHDFQLIIDDDKILIQPWGIGEGETVSVDKNSGMIGYPWLDSMGIRFNHMYERRFRQGGVVNMKSIVPRATGSWKIIKLRHKLQSEGAGRSWSSYVECNGMGV